MSCSRGTFKQIVGLYKTYLGSGALRSGALGSGALGSDALGSGALIENTEKPKDCILCMNIICPCSSYDVNVEPAKDDVLFTNVDFVLRMLEDFFKDIYGDTNSSRSSCASGVGGFDQSDQETPSPSTRDFVSARTILRGTPRETSPQVDAHLAFAEERDVASIPSAHPDLAKALDYEVRKQAAVKQWRAKQRQQLLGSDLSQASQYETSGSIMQSPHQNRYRRALTTLRQPVDDIETISAPALDYNDPRAYLIRTQKLEDRGAFPTGLRKRRKTSSLPFKTVQEGSTVRDLILNVDTKMLNLYKSAGSCASNVGSCDTYVISGTISSGFSSQGLTIDLIRAWEGRVRELMKGEKEERYHVDGVPTGID